jgi:hypothetical protein
MFAARNGRVDAIRVLLDHKAEVLGGLSNRKIGDRMQLSESRVKNIVQCLFNKASVRTRGQLVRVAMDGSWDAARDLLKRLPEPHESSEPGPLNFLCQQPVR